MNKINQTLSDANKWLVVPDGYKLLDIEAQGSYIHATFVKMESESVTACWEVYLNTNGRPVVENRYTRKGVQPRIPFQAGTWGAYDFRQPRLPLPERIANTIKGFVLYGISFVYHPRRSK